MQQFDSLSDPRNLEVYLEDIWGQLRKLRQQAPDDQELAQRHTSRILELSRAVREASSEIRKRSIEIRRS